MRKILLPILLITLASFLLTGCQASDPMAKPYISVYGTGSVKTVPDTVEISITVASEEKDATAQTINAEKADKIIKYLKEIGLGEKEIKTTGANFSPNIKWENGKEINLGYRAENFLQVQTKKTNLISKIVDGSVAFGAERISGLTYTLSDEKKETLLEELIASAVKDGKGQAEATIKSLDQTIGGVKSVLVIKEYASPIYRGMDVGGLAKEMTPTPVLPGELDYKINVNIEFFIK